MINQYHAKIIDRLREAAREHGEILDLLDVLAEGFLYLEKGDTTFYGDDKSLAHLSAAISARAFIAMDRGIDDDEEEGEDD